MFLVWIVLLTSVWLVAFLLFLSLISKFRMEIELNWIMYYLPTFIYSLTFSKNMQFIFILNFGCQTAHCTWLCFVKFKLKLISLLAASKLLIAVCNSTGSFTKRMISSAYLRFNSICGSYLLTECICSLLLKIIIFASLCMFVVCQWLDWLGFYYYSGI